MNLWLLTSQFPPSVVGGIARYVANAADMFARAGHHVTVVETTSQVENVLQLLDVLLNIFIRSNQK